MECAHNSGEIRSKKDNMKPSGMVLILVFLIAIAMAVAVLIRPRNGSPNNAAEVTEILVTNIDDRDLARQTPAITSVPATPVVSNPPVVPEHLIEKPAVTNRLDRLAQIRETFRTLAAGDKTHALRAAKQITDETERETALLTLVTEWTQGELSSPRLRAERIASLGLEAGLGLELGKNPELALLWADEMTEGTGRTVLLQEVARTLVDSDPAAAFALAQRLSETERRSFSDSLFADWARNDTEAALRWAEQFPNPTDREAALEAIRTAAPVGIGAALGIEDGYPVIKDLMKDTPALLSGQLQVGDRIVALAQGGGAFVDVYDAPLADIVQAVRGAPKTVLQLKVIPANAAPNTPPKTIVIMRDQIKFKK